MIKILYSWLFMHFPLEIHVIPFINYDESIKISNFIIKMNLINFKNFFKMNYNLFLFEQKLRFYIIHYKF